MKRPRNSALRRGLRRLTDPRLIGWPFFWASLLAWFVSFYPQVFRSEFSMSWPLVYGWTVSIAGGQLVMFAFLLIAKVLWWRRPFTARHPAIAVWSLIVGSTLGVITASTIANQLPAAEQGLTFGFEHVFFGVIGLMVIGSAIVALGHYKDDVDLLEDRQGALRATLEQGRVTLQDERQATEQTVMSVMTEARSALVGESREAADRLSAASEHVLRPLSHELVTARHGFVPVDGVTPTSLAIGSHRGVHGPCGGPADGGADHTAVRLAHQLRARGREPLLLPHFLEQKVDPGHHSAGRRAPVWDRRPDRLGRLVTRVLSLPECPPTLLYVQRPYKGASDGHPSRWSTDSGYLSGEWWSLGAT